MATPSFTRPNVLYLYTDQQRIDTLSCLGQEAIRTPNIDALAADGALLTQYYVQNPVCGPSRMCFLTGRYASSLGVADNGIPFPDSAVPIQQLLKPYGYYTAQIGKLHFDPHARREHRNPTKTYGFDTFILSDEPGCYDDAYTKWVECVAPDQLDKVRTMLPPAALPWGKPSYSQVPRNTHEPYVFEGEPEYTHTSFVTSQVCDFLRSYDRNAPFFLIAGYYAPHPPLNPPQKYLDQVDRSKLRQPIKGAQEPWTRGLEAVSEEGWRDIAAAYLAMVLQVDEGVGEIVKVLKEKGLYDNTVIVFTSDHGEFLGDHGRIQKGMPGHDCIVHVPCIVRYPGHIPANRRIDALTEAIDIVPTVLDYCGVQTPTYVQGRSLRALLHGDTEHHRDDVLVEWFSPNGNRQTTLRTEQYKYWVDEYGHELLYDLAADPNELENRAQDPAYTAILSQLRYQMIRHIQQAAYCSQEKTDEY